MAAFRDLKAFLRRLEQEGELHVIEAEVDPGGEVAAICRENFHREGPALVFNRVGSYKTPLVVGALGTVKRYALALDTDPSPGQLRQKWLRAYENPIKPTLVKDAPCQEVIKNEVDLYADPFPVPLWHEGDSAPYMGTLHAVITQDPQTGWINVGNYRNEIRSQNVLGVSCKAFGHLQLHLEKWRRMGKESMPVAIAFGLEPYLTMVSPTPVPPQVHEYDIAGGLKGEPVQVVKALTSDLLVPANAQIIVEGEMPTDDVLDVEGPFGEFLGYMGEALFGNPYVRVKAVTHQKDPFFQGTYEGRPPNESTTVRVVGDSVALYRHLLNVGVPGIKDVCMTPAGGGFHAVVAIQKTYPGHAREVMTNVWGRPNCWTKHVTVVDEDVDPWNPFLVEWAMATTVRASRDIEIVKRGRSINLDISSPRSELDRKRGALTSDFLGIDATRPVEYYEEVGMQFPRLESPPGDWLERVRSQWHKYGFR